MKQPILTKNAPQPIGPYNQAIKYDNMLFVSGQIPLNPENGKLVESGIIDETTQVMKNIEAILDESNMSFSDIVKTTIFLKDMGNFSDVNATFSSFCLSISWIVHSPASAPPSNSQISPNP